MLSNIKKIIKNMILSKEELDYLNNSLEKEQAQLLINLENEKKELANKLALIQYNKSCFDYIMNFAKKIEEKNPDGLIELIRVLMKPIQTDELLKVIQSKSDLQPKSSPDFFIKEINQYKHKIKKNSQDFLINLNRDPILPSPWNKERYIKCLSDIGEGKKNPYFGGEWTQDDNHRVNIFLPWGIVIVNGGNHSISAGIICGQGTLIPTEVYDISNFLNEVKCDGENYILIKTNQILDSVYEVRTAAVFEIGRLLQKHNIVPMHI